MDLRNRVGLFGCYFLGMAGVGFTLPYLPLYLGQEGMSDRAIGLVSTFAALAGLAQFPVGIWSDRLGWRKPFLLAALTVVAAATWMLRGPHNTIWLGFLVILFAENGIGRAVVESLSGAEAAALAPRGGVGSALGALRFWKPIGIILVALAGSWIAERQGVGAILLPLAVVQSLAIVAALLIHEPAGPTLQIQDVHTRTDLDDKKRSLIPRDSGLWIFVAAMVLFHMANAPAGVYYGLFLNRDLHAPERLLAYGFAVSMVAWMLVVWPAGRLADRLGRKPLLILGWSIMTLRLAILAMARTPLQAVAVQVLDGLGNGLFAVLAAAWVTDRLADPRRSGEAQVIVGSSLVLGSAIGPALAGLVVDSLGYRGVFWALAAVGALATGLVVTLVPETLPGKSAEENGPLGTVSDLSTTP